MVSITPSPSGGPTPAQPPAPSKPSSSPSFSAEDAEVYNNNGTGANTPPSSTSSSPSTAPIDGWKARGDAALANAERLAGGKGNLSPEQRRQVFDAAAGGDGTIHTASGSTTYTELITSQEKAEEQLLTSMGFGKDADLANMTAAERQKFIAETGLTPETMQKSIINTSTQITEGMSDEEIGKRTMQNAALVI